MKSALRNVRGLAIALVMAVLIQGLGSIALGPVADATDSEVTATTRVHVRTGPSTSYRSLTVLDRGDTLPSHGSTNGWTKVTYRGQTAYVFSRYLTGSSTAPSSVTSNGSSVSSTGRAVTTAALNLRTGPSLRDRVHVVAPRGTTVTLLGKSSGEYVSISYNGVSLWASNRYLSASGVASGGAASLPAVTGKGRATAALLIRTAPGSNYRTITTVPVGTILETTGVTQSGTTQVIYKGAVRWVNARYLSPISGSVTQPAPPAAGGATKLSVRYATTLLNVWVASSGTRYVKEIPRGTAVQITGDVVNGRAAILDDGVIRWVTARYLSTTQPGTVEASGSTDFSRNGSVGVERTNANVRAIAVDVWARHPQIKTLYGWRPDTMPDHPAGRALDVMIPSYKSNQALGWEIANYYRANASKYNINYIIFGQRIWNVARDREGWRWMADRGSDNANHYNHVHINTHG